jgi:hypothetical protein
MLRPHTARANLWRILRAAGLALFLAYGIGGARGEQATLRFDRGKLAPDQVAVPAKIISNLLFVEAGVGGASPYLFLVDTGSTVTLVSDRIAATIQGFGNSPPAQAVQVISAAGGSTMLGSVQLPSLEFGPVVIPDVRAAVYDFVDFSNHVGTTVDGIIGFSVFRDLLLTLDYPRSRIVLSSLVPARGLAGVVLPFVQVGGIRPIVNIELGDQLMPALLDSGSDLPFTLDATACRPSFKHGPRTGPLVATLSGNAPRPIGRLSTDLALAGTTIREPRVMLTSKVSTIGSEILRHFTLTFDQHRSLVVVVPEHDTTIKLPAERTTGLSFARLPAEWRVLQVLDDAPASTRLIRAGDAIVGIDGEPIVRWNLDRYQKHLQRAENVEYLFLRDKKNYQVRAPVYELIP